MIGSNMGLYFQNAEERDNKEGTINKSSETGK
jgi:hypothetical protein